MVQCFLIHTVNPVSTLAPGESRVLYSRVFGPEEGALTVADSELGPEQKRLLRNEKVAVVARQVRSAVTLSREASGRVLVETVLGEELVALQEADSGVQRLGSGEPWAGERSALWLGVQSLAFTLVTEPHENLLLAEGTLKNITRHCLEHLRMLGTGSEVLLKSDRIDVLLHRLLPHGQLLFLNHRFTQSLEKELANYMAQ
ncbi:AP-5 complex subunit sigma-1 [Salmo salar]|uniref:AP-5 complex subunit sigma-1 n=1 Tax=Salmo salar TaxID=8030 RepID=A0A1S3SRY6_SALSA|nr:AP-5 complex subunit sigma-1 [Salmo salar]|eukprot:XP_014067104.1 PREDICTED: AP-5 complex subunit sigma-1 [Salmo salar]